MYVKLPPRDLNLNSCPPYIPQALNYTCEMTIEDEVQAQRNGGSGSTQVQ